jgi:hypothetical protein
MDRRIVVQHDPNCFAIIGLYDDVDGPPPAVLKVNGEPTYYLVQTKDQYALYKRAITGSGALIEDPLNNFHPEQR